MRDDPDGVPPFHYGSHYSSAGAQACGRQAPAYVGELLAFRAGTGPGATPVVPVKKGRPTC
jgi:hypothetical protein